MEKRPVPIRRLGTMIAYGFGDERLRFDLEIVRRLGAAAVEIFPNWSIIPDPGTIRRMAEQAGLILHSAHGCWGSQTIRADRVDLAATDEAVRSQSLDDIKRCIDWLEAAGGSCLVVHPGGASSPDSFEPRREALASSLSVLADHALGTGIRVCVENMPPGVHPGSRMADLANLLDELQRPTLGLALDTGHAHLSAGLVNETREARAWLATTHVHDNDGRKDSHLAPGSGTIDWSMAARSRRNRL